MQNRTSTILIVVGVIAGLAIGFAASTFAYRYHWLRAPGQGPLRRMVETLKLSPAQTVLIAEVMQDTRDKIHRLRDDFFHKRRMLVLDAFGRIRKLLTPEQQAKFDRDFMPPKLRLEAERFEHKGMMRPGPPEAPSPSVSAQATPAP